MKKAYIVEEDFAQDLVLLDKACFTFNHSQWYINAEIDPQALHIIQIRPNGEDFEYKVPQYMRPHAHVTDNVEVALLLQLVHNLADYIRLNAVDEEGLVAISKQDSGIATLRKDDDGSLIVDFADV